MSSNPPSTCSLRRYLRLALLSALPLFAACEADSPVEPTAGDAAVAALMPVSGNFALQFDGLNARVNLSPGSTPASITVEAWARIDAAGKLSGKLHFLVSGAQADFQDGFNLWVFNGQVIFSVATSPTLKAAAISTTAMDVGVWYHVAGTYDAVEDTLRVFVNGVQEAAVSYTGGIKYAARRDLRFGTQIKRFNQSSRFLKGALDEVRIWNYARSADELAADMGRAIAGDALGLLGYWPMNEGTGNTTADATAANNTGVFEFGPVWISGASLPPTATAGTDQTVECTSPDGAAVTLDGSGSSDPAGIALTYTWTDANGNTLASGANPTIALGVGVHTITLTVSNGTMEASDAVVITVEDTTPPEVSAALAALQPVGDVGVTQGQFTVVFSCADACDASPASTADLNGVSVSNGQIVELTLTDGAQVVAWVDGVLQIDASSFSLSASCTDASGNVGAASASPEFAAAPESYRFARFFIERARVRFDEEDGYRFEVRGTLALDPASDGIYPLAEDVSLTFAGYSGTIPAGSFFRKDDDEGYRYDGDTPGIKKVEIRDDGEFRVEARGLDLSGTDQYIAEFSLQIGNDFGEADIWLDREGRFEAEHDDDDDDDDDDS